ncbi:MAG: DMT family transporter [Ignavibacteriales bacterium]|nr:DMT family transporter [Ignavibacteriales bacterium]
MNIYIIMLIQQLIASGTHLIAKTVTREVDPMALTFIRGLISGGVLAVVFFIREKRIRILKEDFGTLFWLSLLAISVNQYFYLYGMKFTLAANGALLYATTPAFVLVFSRFMLGERLTTWKVTGVVIAFIGVSIVIFERGIDLSSDYFFGNVMILFAVIAWALYAIQGKKLIAKYGSFHVSSLTIMLGAIIFIPPGAASLTWFDVSTISTDNWFGILYLALGTSVISYVLWYYAIGKFDTTKVAVFANAQPILTTILAVIILDQPITGMFVIGGVITIAGVLLTQRK